VALLIAFAACNKDKTEANVYSRYDNLIDRTKPVAYGQDNDIYIFAEGENLKATADLLDASLGRQIRLTAEENYFYTISKKAADLNEFKTYKNIIYCGTLDSKDPVSAYILRSLAPNLVEAVRKSGSELFVINNQYVRDQIILFLLAKDTVALKQLTADRSDQIFDYFLDKYQQRLAFQIYQNQVVDNNFFENRPFNIKIPVNFRLFKDDKSGHFLSFIFQPVKPNRQTPDKYISVYYESMPENGVTTDWMYKTRQQLGKKYLNGDEIYEDRYVSEPVQIAGFEGLRMYGHWVNRDLGGGVGGAFQSFAFWHAPSKTAYFIDNIVFFPDGSKLPYLLELGMISQSISVK
jgi:hypothetical protein